jgi:GxxExxY protein
MKKIPISSQKPNPGQSQHLIHPGPDFTHAELTHNIIGSAMEVHNTLGNGFQEVIYQRPLAIELNEQNIPFMREAEMPIFHKGVKIGSRRFDFFVAEKVLVELKAVSVPDDVHLAQGLNYLEAFNFEIGLLINFGARSLQFKRLLNKKYSHSPSANNPDNTIPVIPNPGNP